MRNKHHIVFTGNNKIKKLLRELGFPDEEPLVVELYDDDFRWPAIADLLRKYKSSDYCESHFTDDELRQADWIGMWCRWQYGYPQPDGTLNAYMRETYDLTDYCEKCNSGAVQNRPFRLSTIPKLDQRHIMSLNWVHSAFFVSPEVWETVFAPFGIGYWPVRYHRSGEVAPSIVQLRIDHSVPMRLEQAGYKYKICPVCWRRKYEPATVGMYPQIGEIPENAHIVYSQEFFDGGGEAFHESFISQTLYAKLIERKFKSLLFTPVEK